jgi:ferredoxin
MKWPFQPAEDNDRISTDVKHCKESNQPAGFRALWREREDKMTKNYGIGLGHGRGKRGGKGKSTSRGSDRGIRQGRGTGCRGRRGMTKGGSLSPAPGSSSFPESERTEHEIQVFQARNEILRHLLQSINSQIAKMEKTETALPSWRNMKSGRSSVEERNVSATRAVVDKARCVRCGICVDICPEQAIFMNWEVMIDSNKCNGCGTCVDECPNEALSLS